MHYGAARACLYCPSNQNQNVNPLFNFSVQANINNTWTPIDNNHGGTDVTGNSYDGPNTCFDENRVRCPGICVPAGTTRWQFPAPAVGFINHWDYQANLRPNTPASNGISRANVSSETEIVTDAMLSTGTTN